MIDGDQAFAAVLPATGMTAHRHILYVVDHFPTLSQTFIENQMRCLVEAGFALTILSFGRGQSAVHETTRWLLERVSVRYVELPRLRTAGYHAWRARRLLRPLLGLRDCLGSYRWRAVLSAVAEMTPIRVDAVLAHFGPNGIYAAALRSLGLIDGPLTTFFHGYDFSSFVRKEGTGAYAQLFDSADRFIANSRYSRDRLVAMGCPEDRLEILPVGLLPERFEQAPARTGNPVPHFLTVARLVEKKGHAFTIEALARLRQSGIPARLTLAGDGAEKAKLAALVARLGLGDAVHFAGAQSQEQVRHLMQKADVFVLASIEASDGDVEGQGLVLQEAQACGLPVIASRHNGFPESLRENETGLLVPEGDVPALADAMAHLAADAPLRRAMGAAGPDFVRANFDQRQLTRRLVEMLERV